MRRVAPLGVAHRFFLLPVVGRSSDAQALVDWLVTAVTFLHGHSSPLASVFVLHFSQAFVQEGDISASRRSPLG